MEEDGPNDVDLLFQQDGGSPRFRIESKVATEINVRDIPNAGLPRYPDLISLDFFFWRYIKQATDVPPLSTSLPEFAGKHDITFSRIWNITPLSSLSSHCMYHKGLTLKSCTSCPQSAFSYLLCMDLGITIISPSSIDGLVFITKTYRVW